MLQEHQIEVTYREYTAQPLAQRELRTLFERLGLSPREVLRPKDRAYRELGLDGQESDEELIAHMAKHPTLLQRPIGVLGERAVVGRPVERLLDLVESTP